MRDPLVYNALRHRVWVLWHHTADLISKCENATFVKQTGLSHQHYTILLTMESIGGPLTATVLARRLERNANTVSTMLDRMEGRGLVNKVGDLPDRRSVRLTITEKGREKLEEATKTGWVLIEKLMSPFSEEELQVFARLLEKLRKNTFEELSLGKAVEEVEIKDFQKIVRLLEKAKS